MRQVVDPWGGSYMMESLTNELVVGARKIIDDIENKGGMLNFIESGLAKLMIEECASRKQVYTIYYFALYTKVNIAQARIDSGEDVIVGVNRYINKGTVDEVEVRVIDNRGIVEERRRMLSKLKASRNDHAVQRSLKALEDSARRNDCTSDGNHPANLLHLSIEAMRHRATLGEVSYALEKAWGRYVLTPRIAHGVYGNTIDRTSSNKKFQEAQSKVKEFSEKEGRQPRILVAKMGQDGHDRGAKIIASSFADLGFDVDLAPLFSTPAEVAKQAIDADVHVVGVSSQAAGHRVLVPQLLEELKKRGGERIAVVVGGVIPSQDVLALKEAGVIGVFGPGTKISEAAEEIILALNKIRARQF